MRKILVTGAAGFIGFHLCRALLNCGDKVVGLDNMNPYYDVTLKENRLVLLNKVETFTFIQDDLENCELLRKIIKTEQFDAVINLAAQAGVRYSLVAPEAYIKSNLVGFFNILDACKEFAVPHFLYASSSSVYGLNTKLPFSEDDLVATPVSLYAATKKSNELIAHAYSHMFGLRTTGFRFFTVYGPYGRPDMALFKFTKNILERKPIEINNYGDMQRDFTYIDDIVTGIIALLDQPRKLSSDDVPYRIYNLGNSSPIQLLEFVRAIEEELGLEAIIEFKPLPKGDVKATYADTTHVREDTGFAPNTALKDGVHRFVEWYREYYGL